MKKLLALALILVLALSLAACSVSSAQPSDIGSNNTPSNSSDDSNLSPAPSSDPLPSPSPIPTPSPPPSPDPSPTLEQVLNEIAQNFDETDYDSTLSFDTLARDADSFYFTYVKYSGTVLQISPFKNSNNAAYRVAIDGNTDDVLWLESFDGSIVDTVLEGDMVVAYGIVAGETSYEATSGRTIYLPAAFAVKIEKVDTSTLIEYVNEPFTATKLYSSGKVMYRTSVESIVITSVDSSSSGSLKVNCQVIGQLNGSSYLSIEVKCYDSDGFLLGTKTISASVTDGEKFKIDEYFYAPAGTVKIEFVKD